MASNQASSAIPGPSRAVSQDEVPGPSRAIGQVPRAGPSSQGKRARPSSDAQTETPPKKPSLLLWDQVKKAFKGVFVDPSPSSEPDPSRPLPRKKRTHKMLCRYCGHYHAVSIRSRCRERAYQRDGNYYYKYKRNADDPVTSELVAEGNIVAHPNYFEKNFIQKHRACGILFMPDIIQSHLGAGIIYYARGEDYKLLAIDGPPFFPDRPRVEVDPDSDGFESDGYPGGDLRIVENEPQNVPPYSLNGIARVQEAPPKDYYYPLDIVDDMHRYYKDNPNVNPPQYYRPEPQARLSSPRLEVPQAQEHLEEEVVNLPTIPENQAAAAAINQAQQYQQVGVPRRHEQEGRQRPEQNQRNRDQQPPNVPYDTESARAQNEEALRMYRAFRAAQVFMNLATQARQGLAEGQVEGDFRLERHAHMGEDHADLGNLNEGHDNLEIDHGRGQLEDDDDDEENARQQNRDDLNRQNRNVEGGVGGENRRGSEPSNAEEQEEEARTGEEKEAERREETAGKSEEEKAAEARRKSEEARKAEEARKEAEEERRREAERREETAESSEEEKAEEARRKAEETRRKAEQEQEQEQEAAAAAAAVAEQEEAAAAAAAEQEEEEAAAAAAAAEAAAAEAAAAAAAAAARRRNREQTPPNYRRQAVPVRRPRRRTRDADAVNFGTLLGKVRIRAAIEAYCRSIDRLDDFKILAPATKNNAIDFIFGQLNQDSRAYLENALLHAAPQFPLHPPNAPPPQD